MQTRICRWVAGVAVFALAGFGVSSGVLAETQSGGEVPDEALYPAYEVENGSRVWGYVNSSGAFVIAPQYDAAEEFGSDGLAVVYRDDSRALIDRSGRVVIPFGDGYITAPDDGVRIRYADGGVQLLDGSGAVVFTAEWVHGSFDSGLTPFSKGGLYGYVRPDGSVAIEPQFASASSFEGGKAVVRMPDQTWAIIDTSGHRLLRLGCAQLKPAGEGVFAYQRSDAPEWGYFSLDGEVELEPRYQVAMPFVDGLAVVAIGEDFFTARYGVIDRQGNLVIPAEYGYISYLGDGLFEVAPPFADGVPPVGLPHALFDAQGKQLTDFKYYDVVASPYGVSVSDETSTYFLDRTGQRAAGLPSLTGIGTMRFVGDLIAAEVDGTLSYLTHEGKIVWQAPDRWALSDGVVVADRKHREGRDLLIHYPELSGLPDAEVQGIINERLKSLFLEEPAADSDWAESMPRTLEVGFSVQQVGRVLVVERSGYDFPLGAAHGMPYLDYYHFDLSTGAEYHLADLFKAGSPYPERLRDLVRKQIETEPRGVFDPNPEVRPDQPFAAEPDGLRIYWDPYEIAPYAAGFPTFHIPHADVHDLIDTEGAFWQALRGE